jgi:hypothetical protein
MVAAPLSVIANVQPLGSNLLSVDSFSPTTYGTRVGFARLSAMLVGPVDGNISHCGAAVQVKEPHAYYQDPAAQAVQTAALVSAMELQPTDAQPEVCTATVRPL